MRNWNTHVSGLMLCLLLLAFYITYEELKHCLSKVYYHLFFLFILPMRNWNQFSYLEYIIGVLVFLYYLWGIETRSYNPFLSPQLLLFILPMRNWNKPNVTWFCSAPKPLFILPMRNWNKSFTCSMPGGVPFLYYLWGIETLI